jgi:hypothetical protein
MLRGEPVTTKRIDPEPISIFMAAMATYAAAVATVNFVKTHYKPLPTTVRTRLLQALTQLNDHLDRLRADLVIIEDIFRNARFENRGQIRFGNGAQLKPSDFARYEEAADNILGGLRKIHRVSLKMERTATAGGTDALVPTTNSIGATYTRIENLLMSRDLTQEKSWQELHAVADGLEATIKELRRQLGGE